jgi:hypothetical protein
MNLSAEQLQANEAFQAGITRQTHASIAVVGLGIKDSMPGIAAIAVVERMRFHASQTPVCLLHRFMQPSIADVELGIKDSMPGIAAVFGTAKR